MVSRERACLGDGNHQRRHGRGGGYRAAADRHRAHLFQLALDFCSYRRPGADLGVVVDQVIFFAGGSSGAEPGGTQPVCFHSFRFHAEDALERSASDSRVVGVGECQIPERCGLVFLSFLASEISLRRPRIRREGRRNLRLDSVRRGRNWLPSGRLVFKLSRKTRVLVGRGQKAGPRTERRGHAFDPAGSAASRGLGACDIQSGVLRTAILVHAGNGSSHRPLPC